MTASERISNMQYFREQTEGRGCAIESCVRWLIKWLCDGQTMMSRVHMKDLKKDSFIKYKQENSTPFYLHTVLHNNASNRFMGKVD